MTTEELQQLIDYIKETEEALANWDMDNLAMQTELPIIPNEQHFRKGLIYDYSNNLVLCIYDNTCRM